MDAGNIEILLHGHRSVPEGSVSGSLVTDLPVEDTVIRLARLIGTQHGRSRSEGLERINDNEQWLVGNLDRHHPVRRAVAIRGQHRHHFLGLIHDLLDWQDHLHVRHEGRHPVQVILGQGSTGDDV